MSTPPHNKRGKNPEDNGATSAGPAQNNTHLFAFCLGFFMFGIGLGLLLSAILLH